MPTGSRSGTEFSVCINLGFFICLVLSSHFIISVTKGNAFSVFDVMSCHVNPPCLTVVSLGARDLIERIGCWAVLYVVGESV